MGNKNTAAASNVRTIPANVNTNTTNETMTVQQMMAEIERLKAEKEQLLAAKRAKQTISFKVSEKGAVSVYGMGRFPVTLYGEQWEVLNANMPKLMEFLKANKGSLAVKQAS